MFVGLQKDLKREILNNKGRFFSMLLIVALGVAFFSGIRSSEPDMRLSADSYFDREKLMDVSVICDLGITDGDIDEISKLKDVKAVYPRYVIDAKLKNGNTLDVIRIYSLINEINNVKIIEGKKPQTKSECIIDDLYMKKRGLKIGDTIKIDEENKDKLLKNSEYKITGSCASPEYISFARGYASIGSGEVAGFMFLKKDAFNSGVYIEACIEGRKAREKVAFTEEYKDQVEKIKNSVNGIKRERCLKREADLRSDIEEKLSKEREKLLEDKKKVIEEFDEGEKKLNSSKEKINIEKNRINEGKKEVAGGKILLETKLKDINKGEKELLKQEEKLNDDGLLLKKNINELKKKAEEMEKGEEGLIQQKKEKEEIFSTEKETILQSLEKIEEAKNKIILLKEKEELSLEEEKLLKELEEEVLKEENIKLSLIEINEKEKVYKSTIDKELENLINSKNQVNNSIASLESDLEKVSSGTKKIIEEKNKIEDGRKEIEKQKNSLLEKEDLLSKGEAVVNENEEKLNTNISKLKEEKTNALEKFDDGFKKIDAQKEKLDKRAIVAKWHVLDRDSLPDYKGYGDNADRMGAVGRAFPALFFLVAALISLTTMTRLVEEERMEIGTLKALGYKKINIAGKYIKYAFIATIAGSLIGVMIGEKLFPKVIVSSYKILYPYIPDGVYPYHPSFALLASGLSLACTIFGAISACNASLKASPAALMRPPSPKKGKRIFLERFKLWKKFTFIWKVTYRNLFRYKKRFFMTVFGIGGCMALMLVGYGIRDSITDVREKQYRDLIKSDATIFTDEELGEEYINKVNEAIKNDKEIKKSTFLYFKKGIIKKGKEKREVYFSVVENDKTLKDFVEIRNRKHPKEKMRIPDNGVIISEKLAKLLKVKKDDKVEIKNKKVVVKGICENYVGHFAYMNEKTWENITGNKPQKNVFYILGNKKSIKKVGERLLLENGVVNISYKYNEEARLMDMLKVMDLVIAILIIAAGGLAFIVLYNLNNINIQERKRELATIKVLGFYDREVSAYIYRENILLTIIGSIVGCGIGSLLHRYIIGTVEVDEAMFGRKIFLSSYGYSLMFTILFSVIVGLVMYYKLKKIDMASSLKSME